MLKKVKRENVTVLPGLFRERMNINRNYLMELDKQCLLQNFYLESGVIMPGLQVVDNPENANLHWGWEAPTCQLRGHFLGHWLSAAAAYYASEKDMEIKVKLDKIISELAMCQQLNGGEWIGSIPEKYFQKLADNRYIWSPQYVMHKTIMGLTDAYKYAGSKQALDIVDHLSDWYIRWTDKMQKINPGAIYSGEQGGMLEIWADLYSITKDKKYMRLAERYSDNGVFRALSNGRDALSNEHANASIPLSHGSAKMYEVTGDEKWRRYTELFWKNAVTDRGTYCTGGQNAGEFWVPPFMQGQFLGINNQEFCTVYNMVRTASYLYEWTGNTVYADYIERCLYNGFLAQQNPVSGMPTYFLPLSAGSRKKWGSKRHDFWCCHGTMVQAQTLYPELIYFEDMENSRLLICQYIPSRLYCRCGNADVIINQISEMKGYSNQTFFDERSCVNMSRWSFKFEIECSRNAEFTLSFRVPYWVKGDVILNINGTREKSVVLDGYLNIKRNWSNDTVDLFFPSGLTMEPLPDMPELAAVTDGPVVLAGITGSDIGIWGDYNEPKKFLYPQIEHTYGIYPWKQGCYVTRNQPENFMFKPLYDVVDETYTVYYTRKK
ncbi:MAG: glycoside hydrolase family 127 protein [Oscillospiraceae bacterium]|nr:glycoside hydrolase family 127 protein [Oscillospiraceae bacterium]